MSQKMLANTGKLSRFILRLDRIRIPLWIIGIVIFSIITPPAFANLYKTKEARDALSETMANPAMTAMLGVGDLDHYTIGAMTAHNMLLMTATMVGLMAILLVTRHTRADEEDGRLEIIRSLPTGRLAYLNATLLVMTGTFLVLALSVGLALYSLRIESIDLEGSLLYGAVLGGTGLVFTGITAVFAQISESSRGTLGFSVGFLLFVYLFRAITDISNPSFSWLSPLGWVSKAEVYSGNNWGTILLMLVVSILLFILANYLNSIRDLDQAFIATRPGRRNATKILHYPFGLAFRLQRTGFIAWMIGLFVLGASYGSVFGDLESFISSNDIYQQMLQQAEGATIAEQFLPSLMVVLTLLATVPTIMAFNKIRGEEKKGRLEHLLARSVSKIKLFLAYVILAVVNAVVMILVSCISLWSAANAVMDEGIKFTIIFQAAIVFFPAILVMIGFAAFLNGFFPRMTLLVWIYIIYSFFVLYMGNLLELPEWLSKLSPFGYVPRVPIEEASFLSMFLLSVTGIVFIFLGVIGYRKRDITAS